MKLNFEYGQGTMAAELPDNTDVFIPGETVKDPAYIPEDQLEAAYLESLAHPIGMPTLTELAGPGKTVTIVVPDRVKGGEQATSHRKLSIKYILKELYAAGIEKKDILFIISNGLHPRSTEADAKEKKQETRVIVQNVLHFDMGKETMHINQNIHCSGLFLVFIYFCSSIK